MLIDDPPQHTPGAWKMKRYLVDRTQNMFWEWTAIHDGHFPTASLVGPVTTETECLQEEDIFGAIDA
jgi:hypothetical protein